MNIAVIFAGGVGSRMHSKEKPKQFLNIYNKPVIIHTLEHFEKNEQVDAIVIASVAEWIPYLEELIYKYRIQKVRKIVPGGLTGQLSIYSGLTAAEEIAGDDSCIVLIHDGVRPLINGKVISDNIACVKEYGSAVTVCGVKETVILVKAGGEVQSVQPRDCSKIAKAPQSFYLKDILNAHRRALAENRTDFIDSCTMMQYYGYDLHTVDGPNENIKITTPDDFYTMRAILEAKENAQIYGFEEED